MSFYEQVQLANRLQKWWDDGELLKWAENVKETNPRLEGSGKKLRFENFENIENAQLFAWDKSRPYFNIGGKRYGEKGLPNIPIVKKLIAIAILTRKGVPKDGLARSLANQLFDAAKNADIRMPLDVQKELMRLGRFHTLNKDMDELYDSARILGEYQAWTTEDFFDHIAALAFLYLREKPASLVANRVNFENIAALSSQERQDLFMHAIRTDNAKAVEAIASHIK